MRRTLLVRSCFAHVSSAAALLPVQAPAITATTGLLVGAFAFAAAAQLPGQSERRVAIRRR